MTTSVSSAFAATGLVSEGAVPWGGVVVSSNQPGLYVVSLSQDPNALEPLITECPPSDAALDQLLTVRPELTVDGARPRRSELRERLRQFWLPDEVILYIGLAGTSLKDRVRACYRTSLGARSPHAGGWFIKTLEDLDRLFVHFATAADPNAAERAALNEFCGNVSKPSQARLHDPQRPLPFANLRWPGHGTKLHGIQGATAPRGDNRRPPTPTPAPRAWTRPEPGTAEAGRTQRVTAADLRVGQIRIPSKGMTKNLLPSSKQDTLVELRGAVVTVAWDPRIGPDRERSGILRFRGDDKSILRSLVSEDEVLTLRQRSNGWIEIR